MAKGLDIFLARCIVGNDSAKQTYPDFDKALGIARILVDRDKEPITQPPELLGNHVRAQSCVQASVQSYNLSAKNFNRQNFPEEAQAKDGREDR